MINYREILRLHSLGYSQRRIEASVRSSRHTVSSVLKKAEQQNIHWPLGVYGIMKLTQMVPKIDAAKSELSLL